MLHPVGRYRRSASRRPRGCWIAIARAPYGDPSILFLDEAGFALDKATERDIMDHIRTLADQVTVLAITHRRSVIAPTDKVVALAGGSEVREQVTE